MVTTTLLLAAASAAVVGTAYMYVGARLAKRDVPTPVNRRALLAFSTWWIATAVNNLASGVVYLLAAVGTTSLPAQMVLAIVQRALLAMSIIGLMYYLTYVLTGRGRPWLWSCYGVLLGASLLASLLLNGPVAVEVSSWRTDVETARTSPTWLALAHFVAITLPPVVGAMGYFTLYFKVPAWAPRMRRLRILVVSWGITLWWALAVLSGQAAAFESHVIQVSNRIVGVLVAVAVLVVYQPPSWLTTWIERPAAGPEPEAA